LYNLSSYYLYLYKVQEYNNTKSKINKYKQYRNYPSKVDLSVLIGKYYKLRA